MEDSFYFQKTHILGFARKRCKNKKNIFHSLLNFFYYFVGKVFRKFFLLVYYTNK
jgi:hypothetical protein